MENILVTSDEALEAREEEWKEKEKAHKKLEKELFGTKTELESLHEKLSTQENQILSLQDQLLEVSTQPPMLTTEFSPEYNESHHEHKRTSPPKPFQKAADKCSPHKYNHEWVSQEQPTILAPSELTPTKPTAQSAIQMEEIRSPSISAISPSASASDSNISHLQRQRELKQVEDELNNMKNQLFEFEEVRNISQAQLTQINQLKDNNINMQAQIDDLNNQNEELTQANFDNEKVNHDLKKRILEFEEPLKIKQNKIEELCAQLHNYEIVIKKQDDETYNLEKLVDELNKQREEIMDHIIENDSAKEELQQSLQLLQDKLEETQRQNQQSQEDLEQKLERITELERNEEILENLKLRQTEHEEEVIQLKQNLKEEYERKMEDLIRQAKMEQDSFCKEIEEAKQDLLKVAKENEALMKKIKDCNAQNEWYQEELSQYMNDTKKYLDKINLLERNQAEQTQAKDHLQKQIESLEEGIENNIVN
jgi:chromosome segregation ATPase